jgi:glucoamylase
VPVNTVTSGLSLAIEDSRPFSLHWGHDGWQSVQDREADAAPFGLWVVQITADELATAGRLNFTRRYSEGWEGVDYVVQLG